MWIEFILILLSYIVFFPLRRFLLSSTKPNRDGGETPGIEAQGFSEVKKRTEPVAVIGVGCRFPKAKNKIEFWNMLVNGISGIVKIPEDRWNADDWYDRNFKRRSRIVTKLGGFIGDIDKFDATFFGINAHEASRMDPQHRQLLEVVYEGFQDAGLLDEHIRGKKVGVFVGISSHDYSDLSNQQTERVHITGKTITGNSQSLASNRISYVYDLKGPSYSVDTACSSSAVAINAALLNLSDGICDLAIVGGTNINLKPETTLAFSQGGFLSPDGHCKSFDSEANGYVRSEGVGCLILKPLSKALRDGDRIYTTVIGSYLNQDGRTNGIAQPSEAAQIELMRTAYERIGLHPSRIQYVEAHGTGTKVGDPIEGRAIGKVIGVEREDILYVGSVKSNIGHLEPASAMAGLIKCCLAMKNRVIPKNINLQVPNPEIDWKGFNLEVPVENKDWQGSENGDLFCSLNSFGFGGSNGHVILHMNSKYETEMIPIEEEFEGKRPQLVTISARSEESLRKYVKVMIEYLSDHQIQHDTSLRDLCYTMNLKRDQHRRRLTFVVHTKEELKEQLQDYLNGENLIGLNYNKISEELVDPKICFVYSGQGPQYFEMGRELYHSDKVFRAAIEKCDQAMKEYTQDWSLLEELVHKNEENSRINDTRVAQPCIFAIQVGLTEYWRSKGLRPICVVGHSIGEVAANWACGHLSFEDAVKVIYYRSRSQKQFSGKGKMIAIGMGEQACLELLSKFTNEEGDEPRIGIAAINGPNLVVLSGDTDLIEKISEHLTQEDVFNRILRINVPFHSHYMNGLKDELICDLQELSFHEREIPYYSTVSGSKFVDNCDGEYWFQNVRRSVKFTSAITEIIQIEECKLFIEISNHPILSKYVNELLELYDNKNKRNGLVVPCIRRKQDEEIQLLDSIGKIHVHGVKLNLKMISRKGNFVDNLPFYQFQKQKYWKESKLGIENRKRSNGGSKFPFLDPSRHVKSVTDENNHTWKVNLDTRIHIFIRDHLVQGEIIFPGAGFCELVLQCGLKAFSDRLNHIKNLRFLRALYLPKEYSKTIQFNLNYYDGEFQVFSKKQEDDDEYEYHITGNISHHFEIDDFQSEKIEILLLRKNIEEYPNDWVEVDVEYMYSNLYENGLMLGPAFRGIRKLYTQSEFFNNSFSGITVSHIESDESIVDEDYRFVIHPCLLDSAFQSMFGIMYGQNKVPGVYIPSKIKKIKYHGVKPGTSFWTYGRIDEFSGKQIVASIWIFSETGELCFEIQGFTGTYIEGTRREKNQQDVMNNSLFQYDWIISTPQDEKEKKLDEKKNKKKKEEEEEEEESRDYMVLFSDENGFISDFFKEKMGNSQIIEIIPDLETEEIRKSEDQKFLKYYINPMNEQHYESLFEEIFKNKEKIMNFSKLVFAWSVYDSEKVPLSRENLEKRCIHLNNFGIINIMKQIEKTETSNGLFLLKNLFFLTNNVFQVKGEEERKVGILGSSVWGFVRSCLHEYSQFLFSLIDLSSHQPNREELDILHSIINNIALNKYEVEYAIRGNVKYIHKLRHFKKNEKIHQDGVMKNIDPTVTRFETKIETRGVLESIKLFRKDAIANNSLNTYEELEDDEIEINVKTAGLNYKDVMNGMKLLPPKALENGYTGAYLGMESTGIVSRIGNSVTSFEPGDEVMCISKNSFSSFVITKERFVISKPKYMGFEEAASIPFAYLTAFYSLVTIGRISEHEKVLIHSATGGVGIAAIRICQKLGCEIYVTAGNEEKREYLHHTLKIPKDRIFDSRSNEFAIRIKELTNQEGVDVILNSLSGRLMFVNFQVLAAYGRFLELGKTDIYKNNKLGLLPFGNNISYTAIDIDKLLTEKAEVCKQVILGFIKLCDPLEPHPVEVYHINRIKEAFQRMAASKHIGKVVITMRSDDDNNMSITVYPPTKPTFHDKATYVISGGTKGFGIKIGEYILRNGGRNLVLFSRSGVTDEKIQKVIERYQSDETKNIKIKTFQCDVTKKEELRDLFQKIENDLSLPPVRGIIHSVLVLQDGFVSNMTLPGLTNVTLPKMLGGLNLTDLVMEKENMKNNLDFFVSISSMSSHWGTPGQANYSSGNAFLEVLSRYQKEVLLFPGTCCCVAYGPFGDSGYVSRNKSVKEMQFRQGFLDIPVEDATKIFGFCLSIGDYKKPMISILGDWDKIKKTTEQLENETVRRSQRFDDFFVLGNEVTEEKRHGKRKKDIFVGLLSKTSTEEDKKEILENVKLMLEEILVNWISEMSGLRKKEIEVDESIINYGFDSMITAQLRNLIQSDLGVDFSLMKIMKGVSVSELSEEIIMMRIEQMKNRGEEEEEESEEVEGEGEDEEEEEGEGEEDDDDEREMDDEGLDVEDFDNELEKLMCEKKTLELNF